MGSNGVRGSKKTDMIYSISAKTMIWQEYICRRISEAFYQSTGCWPTLRSAGPFFKSKKWYIGAYFTQHKRKQLNLNHLKTIRLHNSVRRYEILSLFLKIFLLWPASQKIGGVTIKNRLLDFITSDCHGAVQVWSQGKSCWTFMKIKKN